MTNLLGPHIGAATDRQDGGRMTRAWLAPAAFLAALAASACEPEEIIVGGNNDSAAVNEQQAGEPLNPETAELPPMIERSPSYRCTDGDALYVDVLTDGNAVMVRNSRSDIPVRLTRSEAGESFSGEERTLSGTGAEVRYSAPGRPDQICREAEM